MESLKIPKNAIEISMFYTWMGDDGICRTAAKEKAVINLNDAQENSDAVNGFFREKKFPLLIDARNVKSMSIEARKHFSTNGRTTKINSFAVMVKSPLSRVIGNFFMGINKPEVPARLFDRESEAVSWLKEYL